MTNDPTKDDEISRLYRESAKAEPPPPLDAAIRAAAHDALVVRPPLTAVPAWRRWRLPIGVFATLVLTVSLTLLVEREQVRELESTAPPAASVPSAPSAPSVRRAPDVAPAHEAPLALQPPVAPSSTSARPATSAPPAQPATAPAADAPSARRAEGAPGSEPSFAAPATPAPGEGRADAEVAKAAKARPSAEAAASGRAAEGAVQDRATIPVPMQRAPAAPATLLKQESTATALGAAAQRAPERWLEDIRRLRREGRADEARTQLAEFVRAYPDYVLPEDLRR